MTTKFSQRGGTQTLPPVCRSTTVILPSWSPPPYLDLVGYCSFKVKRNDNSWLYAEQKVRVPNIPPAPLWQKVYFQTKYRLQIVLYSYDPPAAAFLDVLIIVPAAPIYAPTWYTVPYIPGRLYNTGQLHDAWPYYPHTCDIHLHT